MTDIITPSEFVPPWGIDYLPAAGAPGGNRYKVAWGGRGSSKSWTFARIAVSRMAHKPMRFLCARELQISIKDSVHHLLASQIEALNAGFYFEVGDSFIRTKAPGGEFLFRGLRHNASEIKSMEAIKICWVEEAQAVSEDSWKWLLPTIREDNSEVWVTFNPEMTTDPTYLRFVHDPAEGAIVRHVNYWDNPWFPASLELERLTDKRRLTNEDYECIWEGKPKRAVTGAIYAGEVEAMYQANRVRDVPADPSLPVHAVWDMGWADSMAIIMVQRVASEVRVVDYLEDSHQTLDWYVRELKAKPYTWGNDYLPHDAWHKDYKTGKSGAEILEGLGRTVERTPDTSIEDGIRHARMMFPMAFVDRDRCTRLLQCLGRYRRRMHARTSEPMAPEHDEFSHGADAWRYLGLVVDQLPSSMGGAQRIKRRGSGMAV
jgi:phage terminase large subunit